ncbi:hypothetical protein AKJ50_01290 [candidate division MSBL1 archaeon SCGC-AAA382A13]|uniref:Uncharacterized protein n=1 Tax=candidate division MSBL1 archaeon SCGC-AAA382A13 TaxID=1698279 RepID=A0A133VFS6_9EURY|nr:hypothetical protein AKJ50_01290 [candidate division MSBL1 archaeon SCGC-AAA382A13]
MEKADERDPEIGAKSARAGFVTASVLLVLLSIYEIIETGEFPPALGVLGASQAVFWIFYLYHGKSPEKL